MVAAVVVQVAQSSGPAPYVAVLMTGTIRWGTRRSLRPTAASGVVHGVDWEAQHAWVLPREATSAALARRHVEASCPDLSREQLDTARLLVTELVSNALRHGEGPVVLVLSRTVDGLRVGVEDDGPSMPAVTHHPVLAQQGRGLQIVAGLASTWGVVRRGDGQPGKQVWFDLG